MCCGNRATVAATEVLLIGQVNILKDVVTMCCGDVLWE